MKGIRLRSVQLLEQLIYSYHKALRLTHNYPVALFSEVLTRLPDPDEWSELSVDIFKRNPTYSSESHNRNLFDWEERAMVEFFPQPPARILIGAAGGGREMIGLTQKGYDVAGFDPCKDLVDVANNLACSMPFLSCVEGSFEDLMQGTLSAIETHAPYHGVILGWGGLSYIGTQAAQQHLLQKIHSLCPNGPLLMSWFEEKPVNPRHQRMKDILTRIGLKPRSAHINYLPDDGWHYAFSHQDISDLARAAGYQVLASRNSSPLPHTVLRPI